MLPPVSISDRRAILRWQAEQKSTIDRICDKYGSQLRRGLDLEQYLVDPEYKWMFCGNPKVT